MFEDFVDWLGYFDLFVLFLSVCFFLFVFSWLKFGLMLVGGAFCIFVFSGVDLCCVLSRFWVCWLVVWLGN